MIISDSLKAEIESLMSAYWGHYLRGEWNEAYAYFDEKATLIGSSSQEVYLKHDEIIGFFRDTADEVAGKVEFRNRDLNFVQADPYILINEFFDTYILYDDEWSFYSALRISTILNNTEKGWKIIHQHGSVPDYRANSNETLAFEHISKENIELREAVKRRTTELEQKNRELEIEASLDRVRARSIGMLKSIELQDVILLIYDEMKQLGIETDAVQVEIFRDGSDAINVWVANEFETYGSELAMYPVGDGVVENFVNARKNGAKEFFFSIDKEMKDQFYKEAFKQKDFSQMPEGKKNVIFNGEYLTVYAAIEIYTALHLVAFDRPDFDPEHKRILKRISEVFDQFYTRFLDLKKVEEQSREAGIEASLERVRSRTMAMHHSDELKNVIQQIYKEITHLGIEAMAADLLFYDESTTNFTLWVSGTDGTEGPIHVQDFPHSHQRNSYTAWKEGAKCKTTHLKSEDFKTYFEKFFDQEASLLSITDETKSFVTNLGEIHHTEAFTEHGCIRVASIHPLANDECAILERFASVFDQTYARFQDLLKAEHQAYEARVEASLERIRGLANAMNHSDDLEQIAEAMFHEMEILKIKPLRYGLAMIDQNETEGEIWASTVDDGRYLDQLGTLSLTWHPMLLKAIEVWKSQFEEFFYVLKGAELNSYYQKIATINPSVKNLDSLLDPNTEVVQYCSFFPFKTGILYSFTEQPPDEDGLSILKRFANVFSQAHTRFEDLQKSEEQDRLIREEKVRLEEALEELRTTQEQLIQQEKLASLGQLTAGIAHEIKNPLNFVNNFSDLSIELIEETREELSKTPADTEEAMFILKDVEANLKKIYEHGTRADSIVKSMLQHSRGGSGKMESTDLNALIKEYVNLSFHGMRAGKNPINVDLQFELDESIGKIPLITEDFSRVIINLSNNAFDAMRSKLSTTDYKPTLSVKTSISESNVFISIEDNGPGIPKEHKELILEPFFTTKKGKDGTGLGLSITNDIIKAHRGHLSIETEENKFSRFTICLMQNGV